MPANPASKSRRCHADARVDELGGEDGAVVARRKVLVRGEPGAPVAPERFEIDHSVILPVGRL